MEMDQLRRRALLSWAAVGVLAVLCGVLAIMQYKWVGQVSRAEQERRNKELLTSLTRLTAAFQTQIQEATSALRLTAAQIEAGGREEAYAARYRRWHDAGHGFLFKSVALAVPDEDAVSLAMLDLSNARFRPALWPDSWTPMRRHLQSRLTLFSRDGRGDPGAGRVDLESTPLFEIPRFEREFFGGRRSPERSRPDQKGPMEGRRAVEQEWLILELDLDYVRKVTLPQLIEQHLGEAASGDYQVEVTSRAKPSDVIYRGPQPGGERRKGEVDASVTLLDTQAIQFRPMMGMRGKSGKKGFGNAGSGEPPDPQGRGRWLLTVTHPSGWGESVVARARWRNLGISAAIFLLMLTMVAALLRITRQSQQLAALQMNFVANVSHELRTPLTVIRTAAHNLKGRVAGNPTQVERYGQLIQQESERLTELVEQVLRFAGAQAGNVIRGKEPVALENVIEDGLRSSKLAVEGAHCTVEKNVEPGLPLVMADEVALRHAIQNLLDNAVKYGIEGSNWIGISAVHVPEKDGHLVEIRIADHGPGIPAEEQERIFDPFFRGRRAVMDQIHGTGLGLNLVKGIVEAHGGTVRVLSEPMKGTEFIIRIPAAPPELQDEYAHSFD